MIRTPEEEKMLNDEIKRLKKLGATPEEAMANALKKMNTHKPKKRKNLIDN